MVVRIIARATVAVADVEHVIRTESHPSAIVVFKLGRVFQNNFLGGMLSRFPIFRSKSNDPRLLFLISVVHIEAPAFDEIRGECES